MTRQNYNTVIRSHLINIEIVLNVLVEKLFLIRIFVGGYWTITEAHVHVCASADLSRGPLKNPVKVKKTRCS